MKQTSGVCGHGSETEDGCIEYTGRASLARRLCLRSLWLPGSLAPEGSCADYECRKCGPLRCR